MSEILTVMTRALIDCLKNLGLRNDTIECIILMLNQESQKRVMLVMTSQSIDYLRSLRDNNEIDYLTSLVVEQATIIKNTITDENIHLYRTE